VQLLVIPMAVAMVVVAMAVGGRGWQPDLDTDWQ